MRPEVYSQYIVTLRDGSTYKVRAVNEFHARNLVVYGVNGKGAVAGYMNEQGEPVGEIKVHAANIASVKEE